MADSAFKPGQNVKFHTVGPQGKGPEQKGKFVRTADRNRVVVVNADGVEKSPFEKHVTAA